MAVLILLKIDSMIITEATLSDLQHVVDIYNQNLGTTNLDLAPIDKSLFYPILDLSNSKEKLLIGKLDGELIGWSVIKKYSNKEGYQHTCETSTYITKAHQSKGYGRQLKEKTLAVCKYMGYHHLVAKILVTNTISIDLCLKMGYQMVGVQKQAGKINGQFVDVAILQYIFE